MASESAGEKTEQPTGHRISKTRGEGNVPQSQEMPSAIGLIVLTAMAVWKGPDVTQWAMAEIREGFSCKIANVASPDVFLKFASDKFVASMMIMMPFFFALMVSGVTSGLAIGGYNCTMKPLRWKLSELDPIAGTKKLFSISALVKLGLSIIKLIFVGIIVYFYVRGRLDELVTYQFLWPEQLLAAFSNLILGAVIRLCIGLLIIGAVDLAYQKWKYTKDLKMTKQEVKQEAKNQDTPPEIKSKIRQKQYEASMRRMLNDVPDANVVLVNPTHVAVALKYDPATMAAPVVIAKGGDHTCEKIKEIARAYGVPIIRRPALARNIYSTVDISSPIPDNLFTAVAEVLALIFRLRNNR